MATTRLLALAPACWPGGLSWWNGRGSASRERRWGRKARSFRSNGSPTPPPPASEQKTDAGSTSSCMARRAMAGPCAATPRSCPSVSPLTRTGHLQPCAAVVDGAALKVAERRKRTTYPELERGGPQKLVVLGSEVGGRWNEQARRFVQDLVRLKGHRAPPALRAAACGAWARRWWSMLSVAVQQTVGSTALGGPWMHPLQSETHEGPPLDALLHLEAPAGQSRLPLRP